MRATLFAITHDGRLARRLTMVIGVGPIVASNIVTVLDDVGRFASAIAKTTDDECVVS